jgi:hypothetical protein
LLLLGQLLRAAQQRDDSALQHRFAQLGQVPVEEMIDAG